MLIGVPKEIKNHEYRVGLVPESVHELCIRGHQVVITTNAGLAIQCSDDEYMAAGAVIAGDNETVYRQAEMIIKVKEPQPSEYALLRENQILFTFLHLAPYLELTKAIMASGCTAISYETVTNDQGELPLLSPMSEVAGRLAIQVGAQYLTKSYGTRGILLGGVPGVSNGHVVVIGGGVVGLNAVQMAVGLNARVTVLDKSLPRLRELTLAFGNKISTIYSTKKTIEQVIRTADLVVGAVLVHGAKAPKLITTASLPSMIKGAVMVDVAIDQGGCFETSKPTTHSDPIYFVDDILHYCVTNMPALVPRTSSFALNNATLPFVIELANKGLWKAITENHHLLNGVNVYQGKVTYRAVAESLNLPYSPVNLF